MLRLRSFLKAVEISYFPISFIGTAIINGYRKVNYTMSYANDLFSM